MKPTLKAHGYYRGKFWQVPWKKLKSQRALDKMSNSDTSLFGIKIYKSLKAAKISNELYSGSSGYYRADGGTSILLGETILYFKSTEDE